MGIFFTSRKPPGYHKTPFKAAMIKDQRLHLSRACTLWTYEMLRSQCYENDGLKQGIDQTGDNLIYPWPVVTLLQLRTELIFEREKTGTYLRWFIENLSVLTKPTLQVVSHCCSNGANSTWRMQGEELVPLQRSIHNDQRHTQELTVFRASLVNHPFSPGNIHTKSHRVDAGPHTNCNASPARVMRLYIGTLPGTTKLQILLRPPKSIIFRVHNALAYWVCAANRRQRSAMPCGCARTCDAVQTTATFAGEVWYGTAFLSLPVMQI